MPDNSRKCGIANILSDGEKLRSGALAALHTPLIMMVHRLAGIQVVDSTVIDSIASRLPESLQFPII